MRKERLLEIAKKAFDNRFNEDADKRKVYIMDGFIISPEDYTEDDGDILYETASTGYRTLKDFVNNIEEILEYIDSEATKAAENYCD